MDIKLIGSNLTRAMLDQGHRKIWCAIDDDSDERAITDLENNDFTAYVVSYDDGKFICTSGLPWSFAVPIKISAITQDDVEL
ncbi:hypothetical protein [Psychrobacter sp. CAL346-MNA-CIBAN-0220]|uniref:hypothetical protein n=1 Tax=Psychrobacter sp. CAL346-MNA-CIBAN-0220 TaxID=3140457 RepID=UPI00332E704B